MFFLLKISSIIIAVHASSSNYTDTRHILLFNFEYHISNIIFISKFEIFYLVEDIVAQVQLEEDNVTRIRIPDGSNHNRESFTTRTRSSG